MTACRVCHYREAAYFSQRFTTVSPSYALEVGGDPVLAPHRHKFMGVRNGIDSELWDPENNQFLPQQYNAGGAAAVMFATLLHLHAHSYCWVVMDVLL